MQELYGAHGADQKFTQTSNRMDWQYEGKKSGIYGSEQRGTGTTERSILDVKSGNTSEGMKSEIKHRRK